MGEKRCSSTILDHSIRWIENGWFQTLFECYYGEEINLALAGN
jgi:hypothetical protein